MMLTYALSAFADEISADLDEQLDVLQRSGVRHLELRGVWRKNVLDLTDDEIGRVRSGLRERGVRVSAIGSPIGKVSITDDFDEHLRRFHRALDVARRLETPYIRVFSFYVPQDRDPAPLRDEVIRRMAALCDAADRFDPAIVLLHENEKEIYGDTGDRCLDLLRTIDRPNLRATFDPANFVQVGVRPFGAAYPLLAPYVRYVHVKDARWGDGEVVPAGEGDGELRAIFGALSDRDFTGFLSVEPHLAIAGRSSGFAGPELFARAVRALRSLLEDPARFRPVDAL